MQKSELADAELTPVHRSVRTSTSVNSWPGVRNPQHLRVTTSRLVIGWRAGELVIDFTAHRVRTMVGGTPAPRQRRSRA